MVLQGEILAYLNLSVVVSKGWISRAYDAFYDSGAKSTSRTIDTTMNFPRGPVSVSMLFIYVSSSSDVRFHESVTSWTRWRWMQYRTIPMNYLHFL